MDLCIDLNSGSLQNSGSDRCLGWEVSASQWKLESRVRHPGPVVLMGGWIPRRQRMRSPVHGIILMSLMQECIMYKTENEPGGPETFVCLLSIFTWFHFDECDI